MRINAQHTHVVESLNALRTYGDRTAAIVLISSGSPEVAHGMGRVFKEHDAPLLPLDEHLDWDLKSVGDCFVRPDGIKVFVEAPPSGAFMGMLFETSWGLTDESWRATAKENGCVWLSLLDSAQFDWIRDLGRTAPLPLSVPTLRLDAVL